MLLNSFVPMFVTTLLVTLFLLILLNNTCLSPVQLRGRGDFSPCIYRVIEKMTDIFCKFKKLICHQIGGDKCGDNFLSGVIGLKMALPFFARSLCFFFFWSIIQSLQALVNWMVVTRCWRVLSGTLPSYESLNLKNCVRVTFEIKNGNTEKGGIIEFCTGEITYN